jgi:outer membrane protein assembly factor BamB
MKPVKQGAKKQAAPRARRAKLAASHPIDGVARIAGVTHDGERVWVADPARRRLVAVDPQSGRTVRRLARIPATAGTAFDGCWLYQLTGAQILKLDPDTGAVAATLAAPPGMPSGLSHAAGALWVGDHSGRCIRKLDPRTGRVLKTVQCDRFVTGVTWSAGELWHGTDEEGRPSELRCVDPDSGAVLARLSLPEGVRCSGLEADGEGRLWFGDRQSGTLRAALRPAPAPMKRVRKRPVRSR